MHKAWVWPLALKRKSMGVVIISFLPVHSQCKCRQAVWERVLRTLSVDALIIVSHFVSIPKHMVATLWCLCVLPNKQFLLDSRAWVMFGFLSSVASIGLNHRSPQIFIKWTLSLTHCRIFIPYMRTGLCPCSYSIWGADSGPFKPHSLWVGCHYEPSLGTGEMVSS